MGINLEFIQEFLKFVNGSNEKLKFENAVLKVAKSRIAKLCAEMNEINKSYKKSLIYCRKSSILEGF